MLKALGRGDNSKDFEDALEEDIDKNGYPTFVVTLIDRRMRKEYKYLKDYFYKFAGIAH